MIVNMFYNWGYVIGLIGKWYLGGIVWNYLLRCGFDEFFGFMYEGYYYFLYFYCGGVIMVWCC